MPFTNAEKIRIRTVLGYQNAYRYKNTRLESALETDQVDADGVAFVQEQLAGIAECDAEMRSGGRANAAAGTAAVDKSLRFATAKGERPLDVVRATGRIYISRISGFFGIDVIADYYGMSGHSGDPWSRGTGQSSSGMTRDIKLG